MTNILLVEDNRGDQRLIEEAFRQNASGLSLAVVNDGEEALTYLRNCQQAKKPLPRLILLDLSLPKRDGREVLRAIKGDIQFRIIPVVIFTSSELPRDINECYSAGANCYVVKKAAVHDYFETIREIEQFWFGRSKLPEIEEGKSGALAQEK